MHWEQVALCVLIMKMGSLEYYRNNWAPFNIFNEYDNNKMNISVLDFKVQGEGTYRLNQDMAIKALLSMRQAYTSTTHEVHERFKYRTSIQSQ